MKILHLQHSHDEKLTLIPPSVMALGFYDGVHKGHQHIIQTAKAIAQKDNLALAVMTFHPHPREVMGRKEKSGTHITPLEVKAELLSKLGVDYLIVVKFDETFGKLPASDFVDLYIKRLNVKHAVAGFDFTFGYQGKGNMEQLDELGKGFFKVTTIAKVEMNSLKIGSTLIRQLISQGDFNIVPDYLGSFYEIKGVIDEVNFIRVDDSVIVKLNIQKDFILPNSGCYEVSVDIDGQIFDGVCTIKANDADLDLYKPTIQLKECTDDVRGLSIKMKWISKLKSDQSKKITKQILYAVN